MDSKDIVTIAGVAATFLVSSASLLHSLWSDQRSSFVNTVTSSRLKWIDSLRDNMSEFLAVSTRLLKVTGQAADVDVAALLLRRDTLINQIVLHLNPNDSEDQSIGVLVDHVRELTDAMDVRGCTADLVKLRRATADYLKKEWNRVKVESVSGGHEKSVIARVLRGLAPTHYSGK